MKDIDSGDGVSIKTFQKGRLHPLRQRCISVLFQISPLFPKKILDFVENLPNFTSSENIFIRPNFLRLPFSVTLFHFCFCCSKFLPGWVASPPRNPPPLSWLGTGADSACRFYMQSLWRRRTLEVIGKSLESTLLQAKSFNEDSDGLGDVYSENVR